MDEIKDFFSKFFNTDNFPARWHCGQWSDFHGWLYIISDVAIWAAYYTIPLLLIHFIKKKKDIPFPKIFWLFSAFILACGTTHLIDAVIFWFPIYRVSAMVRLLTAIVSWATIYMIYKILPDALLLKTPAALELEVKQRTEELQVSMQKMRFLADAMPQIVWTAKPDGSRDYFNEPALHFTGKKIEQLLGWKWLDIVHPDDREATSQKWQQSIDGATEFEMENRLLSADGNYYWHLTRALPSKNENGEVSLWVGTATEVEHHKQNAEILEKKVAERTEQLRQVNEELSRSNSDLEQFAAVASHDLQAPLRTISNYLDLLGKKNEGKFDEQNLNYINRSINASERMRNLIGSLLRFSQINASQLVTEKVDLNKILSNVLANIEDLKNTKHAQISYSNLPILFADPIQIEQLLQNLIANGINYNSSNTPTISIDSRESEYEHVISVRDNGLGIPKEYLSKIFEVFTRLQSDNQGSGLGLSISKRIVDKHNGKIWVESEVGQGTTFYFSIPKS